MRKRACRTCRLLTTANLCPNCKTSALADDWVGELIILEPEKSGIAKSMGITRAGRYALRVR